MQSRGRRVHLLTGGKTAHAQPDGAALQGTGAGMRQGRAVESRPHGDVRFGQLTGENLTVHTGAHGKNARLALPGEDLQSVHTGKVFRQTADHGLLVGRYP